MRDHLKRLWTHGDRAFVLLVEIMTHQGARESRVQGEGKQGNGTLKGQGRGMRIYPNRVVAVNWRAGYLETRQSGSGKGRWKRADD